MRAFIVRPFGVKEEIDFERVERELIDPALKSLQIEGRTTGEIARQGNIREDMFRLLVTADLVIADVSIHNANVFYELGIRHALQQRHTLLIRAEASKDKYPFDLQTDRYFLYEPANPGSRLKALVDALSSTINSDPSTKDSPVFQLLPNLKPHTRSALTLVPRDFVEEVDRARAGNQPGDLRLLADEAQGFEWESEGLRLVGNAQFKLRAFPGAKETFEALRKAAPNDVHANLRLGTIYQKLAADAAPDQTEDFLTRSEQAIDRAATNATSPQDRAEAFSLRGSITKTRWLEDWKGAPVDARAGAALGSAFLADSLSAYLRAFAEDLAGYYPGANALAMLKIQGTLARSAAEVWEAGFDDSDKANDALAEREACASRIAAALNLTLGMDSVMGTKSSENDPWAAITRADMLFLTSDKSKRVENEYKKAFALAKNDPFALSAARRNIELFETLGLLPDNVKAALGVIDKALASADKTPAQNRPARVVLFTGHMVDKPDRPRDEMRFPPTARAEAKARVMIEEALRAEMKEEGGVSLGIAGGACGADILFHEICASLGIATRLFLALPQDQFQVASVQRGGPNWVERYRKLCERVASRVLQEDKTLPRWLTDKPDYDVWQRNNHWMMFNALALRARHLSLIALYNRDREADGPGGTAHLVDLAQGWGFKAIELDARPLLQD